MTWTTTAGGRPSPVVIDTGFWWVDGELSRKLCGAPVVRSVPEAPLQMVEVQLVPDGFGGCVELRRTWPCVE